MGTGSGDERPQEPVEEDTHAEGPPSSPLPVDHDGDAPQRPPASPRAPKPRLPTSKPPFSTRPNVNFAEPAGPPTAGQGPLSPEAPDRVFPIRSVVSVDPTPTPRTERTEGSGYFPHQRRQSTNVTDSQSHSKRRRASEDRTTTSSSKGGAGSRQSSSSRKGEYLPGSGFQRSSGHTIREMVAESGTSTGSERGAKSAAPSERSTTSRAPSIASLNSLGEPEGLLTARFKHVISEGGHAVITGRGGETLQRCEDEPIHIPGAVQGFGLLIAFEEQQEGKLVVRVVSENSKRLIGYTPKQLFALESFTDILSEEQGDNLLDHVDFIRDEDADVLTNGPEVFTISIRSPARKNQKLWCAMHINDTNRNLIICEFELEDDPVNPLVPPDEDTPEPPEDTLDTQPTEEEYQESTLNVSKPLRVLRSARKRKGEAAAMEVFNIMSQVQEQLAAAPNLEKFLKVLVGVVKELTGFHRVMVYQFDHNWNGRVVTELVDPRATKDLYKGLNFPASDIPKQARDLYKINKVRMLYDRDQETARLVCRTVEDLETPLDLTHSYLRAMSPIHLKYLGNMAVRSSMSISINAFEELWGLIACHTYGSKGMRVSFPIRKMCRLVGDSASRNIERLSYASRLQARKLINTVPTQSNPSGYIIASSEDLLKLFDADFGLLSIRDETKILGHLEQSQEALAMLEYLRMRHLTTVVTSQDIKQDFPDLRYSPGFDVIAGLLLVPLAVGGQDFIVFFRKGSLKEVKWAGNPYEKFIKEGTEGYLEPRKSFRTWSEKVVGKCREWTEEEVETAAVLCLVYGKFIEVWRQKEAALQNSQLTRLLLANSAHEVRTPLNAIINYLEIALEGSLDQETRDNLAKSHSASKSLIYVINDLLDLTKTEEGGELIKDEAFDITATLYEATENFKGDAKRKSITYDVKDMPPLPGQVLGDQRRIRQVISNITANAIQNTNEGGVAVEMYMTNREDVRCDIEVSVQDTGVGMSAKKLDQLFRELEQVRTEDAGGPLDQNVLSDGKETPSEQKPEGQRALGLGLALVARIIWNMNGQLRLKSEEGQGSRFVVQLPFDLPDSEANQQLSIQGSQSSPHDDSRTEGSVTPQLHGQPPLESPSRLVPPAGEMMLVDSRPDHQRDASMTGRRSRDGDRSSLTSRRSLGSMRSGKSARSINSVGSERSEADRLIDAIQEPHQVDNFTKQRPRSSTGEAAPAIPSSSRKSPPRRPRIGKRHVTEVSSTALARKQNLDTVSLPADDRSPRPEKPGEVIVQDSGVPIRPVKVSAAFIDAGSSHAAVADSDTASVRSMNTSVPETEGLPAPKPTDAGHMNVLVAEDDPVNSKIIKKRLEKLGHFVFLTVNGEECSSAYCDRSGFFDIVLMDMQMPIVDGLTSTKVIRSFEKSHPTHLLSTRASLNGRVPIIAVSASLVEKDRQHYIDAGFDGWILKPISFNRLSEIMRGIVEQHTREANLYRPGAWESGGWFEGSQRDVWAADTRPSLEPPAEMSEGAKVAAKEEGPAMKEEEGSVQSVEQERLLEQQDQKASSLPVFGSKAMFDAEGQSGEPVASPPPMDEQ